MGLPHDLQGRFAVVTGANTGIGRVTAEALAKRGAFVVLACRSEDKTRPVIDAIASGGGAGMWVPLDLGDLASVRAAGERIVAMGHAIDLLVNNAGVGGQRGLTKDGFELAFGTNHLGHFLLTMLLVPKLRAGTRARIVNVSSQAHYRAKGVDFERVRQPTRSLTGMPEYEVSKLANVLFTKELSRRIGATGVHSYALHPGVVASDVWRRLPGPVSAVMKLFMLTNEEGARTSLHCATSPDVEGHDGRYYDDCAEKRPSAVADDAKLAAALWERSATWTGADLPASP